MCRSSVHQKRIIIFVMLTRPPPALPPPPPLTTVTGAIARNKQTTLLGERRRGPGAADMRVDVVTRDDDQCGQEKSARVNIENNKSAVDACQ